MISINWINDRTAYGYYDTLAKGPVRCNGKKLHIVQYLTGGLVDSTNYGFQIKQHQLRASSDNIPINHDSCMYVKTINNCMYEKR